MYDDLVRNEEDPPSSPTLQTYRIWSLKAGFNMFIDFEEIKYDQNTQSPTPSNKIMKIIPHIRSEHIRMEKHTSQVKMLIYVLNH